MIYDVKNSHLYPVFFFGLSALNCVCDLFAAEWPKKLFGKKSALHTGRCWWYFGVGDLGIFLCVHHLAFISKECHLTFSETFEIVEWFFVCVSL